MSASAHPPTIVTGLYHKLDALNLLPEFLKGEHGQPLFNLVVFSWLVIVVLIIVSFIVSRRLRKIPGRFQSAMEYTVESLANLLDSLIGPGGRKYLPLLGTTFIYIFCLNLLGLIPGMISPTANWNSTIALSLTIIFFVHTYAIKELGIIGYFKHLSGSPQGFVMWLLVPLMFCVHLLGELLKPLSLSLRLYGNIFGEDNIILALANLAHGSNIFGFLGISIPVSLMMGFAIFTSFLQAFIFTALSCIYIMTLTTHEESH
jgi:F-type H+-transporting ATPase subunit a